MMMNDDDSRLVSMERDAICCDKLLDATCPVPFNIFTFVEWLNIS